MRKIDENNMFMVQDYNRQRPLDYTLNTTPVTTETLWARISERKCMFDSIPLSDRNKAFGLACNCGKCSPISWG